MTVASWSDPGTALRFGSFSGEKRFEAQRECEFSDMCFTLKNPARQRLTTLLQHVGSSNAVTESPLEPIQTHDVDQLEVGDAVSVLAAKTDWSQTRCRR